MATRIPQMQRFFYSHYFLGGLRQAVGVLLPALIVAGVYQQYSIGMVAAIGAACVAILDQPGGPRRYGTNGMLAAILLGSLTAAVTGLASSHAGLMFLVIPALCFFFSIFTVFGKQGGLLGFACLLLMTLTMRTPLAPHDVLLHTVYSFAGGVFYFVFSSVAHRLFWHREEQQVLSVALFATADYIAARSQFYDMNADLEASYRKLVHMQTAMTEKHQAARDTVLRELPRGEGRADRLRTATLNVFIDMVALLDTLVATQTDYATLRRRLPDADILIFARDALRKLAIDVAHVALNIARNTHVRERNSVKAELRAIEYELENYRRAGMADDEPEIYALLVQILRRLRNAARLVDRLEQHLKPAHEPVLADIRLNKSLDRFLSKQTWRLGMLTTNLRLDSPHFRYAVRVAIAALLAMSVTATLSHSAFLQEQALGLGTHSYWVILTILIVMKPGFALTRQRNGWRLAGTLIGCGLALLLFRLTDNPNVYMAILVITCVLGYSLIQVNYMASAIFNTLFVLLIFHFLGPTGNDVIGERLVDTLIGCGLALLCSYILPWWEHRYMPSLARALLKANTDYLRTGLDYAALARRRTAGHAVAAPDGLESAAGAVVTSGQDADLDAQLREAELHWRLTRKNVYLAFGNFASAFHRMMDEPIRQQNNVPELNNVLIQNHVLASQISAAIPVLASLQDVPEGIRHSLDAILLLLEDQHAEPPVSIETEGELATLAYPLRQMVKAAQLLRQEMRGLNAADTSPARRPASSPA